LKQVNDRYGHLTGSRALCRLADALRAGCRSMDTAARFGGDEFAVILPEADMNAAQAVAQRISEGLWNDGDEPQVSVSIGAAEYPRDGEAADKLFAVADRALYGEKTRLYESRPKRSCRGNAVTR
jgi:diguanylate cyclase (GGDEF)-like protein